MFGNVLLLAVVLLAATAVGFLVRRNSGHFRGAPRRRQQGSPEHATANRGGSGDEPFDRGTTIEPADLPSPLGERATLLQFSSAFCAPCRATRRVLSDVAAVVPGVAHVEVDAEHHLDLVRRVGVLRTPTTVVLDRHGHEISRAGGVPAKAQVLAALTEAVGQSATE